MPSLAAGDPQQFQRSLHLLNVMYSRLVSFSLTAAEQIASFDLQVTWLGISDLNTSMLRLRI